MGWAPGGIGLRLLDRKWKYQSLYGIEKTISIKNNKFLFFKKIKCINYLCLSIGGEIQNYSWGLEHLHHHSRHLNCPHSEKTGQDLKKLNSSIVIYFQLKIKNRVNNFYYVKFLYLGILFSKSFIY